MHWLPFWVVLALALVGGLVLRRNWVAPWRRMEDLIRRIAGDERPETFLVEGSAEARRAGLALEELWERQEQLRRKLTERATGTRTIFAAMQDGLLVVDTRHHIILVNRTFEELFALRENVAGQPLLEVVRDPALERVIAQTMQAGTPQRGELSVADGTANPARRMQLSAVLMQDDAKVTTGAVVLLHDITQLTQADEIRRDFVANVSHELRTPLSILRGYIETLLDDPAASRDELVRILEVMQRHSDRLGILVDDLLTLAQLESPTPNLQMAEVRLSELFAAIVRDWAKKFSEKGLSVDVSIAPDLPNLHADETRLQEILYNLLDNSLKYTGPGGKVRLQAQKRGDDIALSVTDTGRGISEADLPRVFERFYRADKARSRELGGTGLGLSIVKHIAQMHGGRVEAESQLGQGTTIRVLLPLDRSIGTPTD